MTKKLISLTLAAALIFLVGCSSMFKKEYLNVAEYTEEERNGFNPDAEDIKNYSQLKSAILNMVRSHVDEARLFFSSYEGDAKEDLYQACLEVSRETALGSYAVENIFRDLTRIVVYLEATITISYKHTLAEVNGIKNIVGTDRLISAFDTVLGSNTSILTVRMVDATLTQADILAALEDAYCANPLSCVLPPEAAVTFYPEEGSDRIIEIIIAYARTKPKAAQLSQTAEDAARDLSSGFMDSGGSPAFALNAYNALARYCVFDPDGSKRQADDELEPDLGGSPYGALVEGLADSRGMALAYSVLCKQGDISCQVVKGTVNSEEHWWNIVLLGEDYYHVDVSANAALGISGSFLRSDAQMSGTYTWDTSKYPPCPDSMNADAIG